MQIVLLFIDETKLIYLNIKIDIILVNKQFFKQKTFNVLIRIIIFLIFVRDVKANKYSFNKYIITNMYIFNYNKNDVVVKAKIIQKIHLINNLKINIFFNIDFIESKKININIFNKTTYINNCNITALLKIRTLRIIVQISIYARKIIVVFSYTKIILSIHYTIILNNRNFFFESKKLNFLLYAYLINSNSKHILIRNENNKIVHIF